MLLLRSRGGSKFGGNSCAGDVSIFVSAICAGVMNGRAGGGRTNCSIRSARRLNILNSWSVKGGKSFISGVVPSFAATVSPAMLNVEDCRKCSTAGVMCVGIADETGNTGYVIDGKLIVCSV